MQDASDSSGSILFDFADQLLSDLDGGGLQPLAHYLKRFPGHEEAVAREYIALTSCIPTPTPGATRLVERRADRIGPYRLIEILGRGGQGIVYRADDTRLERTVALKVLSLAVASVSQGRRTRFRREAAILARLQHPGICTILDADLEGDTPYIAMRFVEGETLAVALSRARELEEGSTPTSDGMTPTSASRLLSPRRALDLAQTLSFFERAARTLHAAHEAGVVHRDVKPGNLMVSTDGSPVLLDFGLARGGDDDESVALTRSDEVFGTPAYISPEQLDSGRHVDRRTDVYSLGVVLYECLALKRPFQGDSNAALAEAIRFAPIPPLRRANPSLPTDLEVVLETALEKDVARRYPTALELAEELRRVREYEPIRARPAGPIVRLQRWSRRHPVVAMGTFGSIAALSIALTIALVLLRRVRTEEQRKEAALALYEGGWFRDQASGSLPDSPPRSMHYAIAAAERDPGLASNRVLLAALSAMYGQQVLVGHDDFVMQADVDPTSQRVATASLDGTARVWDAHTGQEQALFRHDGGTLLCVRFSPDGRRIVVTGSVGRAWIHDLVPGADVVELVGHGGGVHWAQFSPDGTRVVTASRDHTARVWDARDGRELARLVGHTGSIAEARFLDGGRLVLTRSAEPPEGATTVQNDGTARLFDAESGAELRVLTHKGAIVAFDVSSDGRFVVTASEDHTARLWAVGDTGPDPVRVFEGPGRFHSAAFSPDGARLALSWDAGAKVVDVATGDEVYRLPDHEHRAIVHISWRPDGGELATIARDDALRIFRAADGNPVRTCRGEVRQISGMRWSPDGTFLTSWHRRNNVDVWYGANRPFLPVMRGHTEAVRTVVFDPACERVLTASDDGTARTWRVPSAEPELVFDPAQKGRVLRPLLGAVFDKSGTRVSTTDVDGNVLVWDATDARLIANYPGGHVTQVRATFSPDGTRLAFDDGGGAARILELDSGRTRRLLGHDRALTAMRFSEDGARLATGGDDRRVCLWDATIPPEAGAESSSTTPIWRSEAYTADLAALTSVFDVLITRDGRWVAAACQNVRLEIHDARDGRRLASAVMATPGRLAESHDGSLIMITAKYAQATSLWRVLDDAGGIRLEQVPLPQEPGAHHTNSTTSLEIAASVPLAVTGSLDRTARLWDLVRRQCVASYAGHTDAVYGADVTADGSWIATASGDGTARLWPGDILAAARRAQPAGYASVLGWLPAPVRRE